MQSVALGTGCVGTPWGCLQEGGREGGRHTPSGSVPGEGGGGNEDADSLPPLRSPKHVALTRDLDSYEPRGMSRSVSDSTLRQAASRASLHLPLPVTSLMLFKKELSLGRRSTRAGTGQRKSFISTTSPTLPRCHSPLSQSQCSALLMLLLSSLLLASAVTLHF
ncbi:hypothetical protein FHG87_022502 [Trinorchestia longiramus]|nr:hypothetical protein FHG87_022502 [Trinorchestia longiramus]